MGLKFAKGKWVWLLWSIVSLITVGYVDFITGTELRMFLFYFIPVTLCAWHFGRVAVLCTAVLVACGWWMANTYSGVAYKHEIVRYLNALMFFAASAVSGLLIHHLRHSLIELRRSTETLQQLQKEIQLVCAWTKQIKVCDKWISIETFLRDHLYLTITHGVSPEAAASLERKVQRASSGPLASVDSSAGTARPGQALPL